MTLFRGTDLREDPWDNQDDYIIYGIGTIIWVVWTFIFHFIDHFTFNFVPWYIEPFSIIFPIMYIMIAEEYSKNPINWWPMFCGTKVKNKTEKIYTDDELHLLGGRLNVYQPDYKTLTFRRKVDAFKYTMFNDYRP